MEIKKAFYRFGRAGRWMALAAAFGLVLAACAPAAGTAPAPTTVPTQAAVSTAPVPVTSGEASLSVMNDPTLGQILVGNNGMTVYAFTKDGPNQSNCTGQCAALWPALKTLGNPQIGPGVNASLVGSATLADGSKVVTYNKMPLYFFIKDKKAGDVTGQDFGKLWFTVSPDGTMVGKPTQATPAAAAGTAMATQAAAVTPGAAAINVVTDPKLGKILVDGMGMTLYIFTKDTPDTSNCTGNCAVLWPPLVSQGSPQVGSGVNAAMIGTATLADGSKVLTYNHMPLYRYSLDKAPGDVKGEGVLSVWFAISPDGTPVKNPASSGGTSGY